MVFAGLLPRVSGHADDRLAQRSMVIASYAALPAIVPALVGAFVWKRMRNQESDNVR